MHFLATGLAQVVTVAHETAQGADIIAGTKRTVEQSVAVQPLQPLASFAVGFPPRHLAHLAGVDQKGLQTCCLQLLKPRDPVNRGGFQRHGLDPALQQPLDQFIQILGESRNLADRGLARGHCVFGNTNPMGSRPHVNTRRLRVNPRHQTLSR